LRMLGFDVSDLKPSPRIAASFRASSRTAD
jgi:hypothetical protein